MLGEKIEKRLNFLRIPNLMFIIVVVSAFIFVVDHLSLIQNGRFFLASLLHFNRSLILKGQIWRVLSFVFTTFSGSGLFFAVLEGYFLYFLGTSLEVSLGEHRFSVFYIFGVFLSIIVGFLTGSSSTFFLNMSLFFVFATINPNRKMLLFFVIPIETMWLGLFDLIYFMYRVLVALIHKDYTTILNVVVAIVNFLIFFGPRFFMDIYFNLKSLHQKSKRMYKNGSYWGN